MQSSLFFLYTNFETLGANESHCHIGYIALCRAALANPLHILRGDDPPRNAPWEVDDRLVGTAVYNDLDDGWTRGLGDAVTYHHKVRPDLGKTDCCRQGT